MGNNAATLTDGLSTPPIQKAFGEVARVGMSYYHMYVRDLTIKLSYFKNGEKIF